MALQNNAFYLLKISVCANKRNIVSAADEMSFLLDPEVCSNAQNELINTNKRLSSEINWFVDTDDESVVERIRSNIEKNEIISTDGLAPLSKLNASLYNLILQDYDDSFELGYSILEIDGQFSDLDVDCITEIINNKRNSAGFPSVQSQMVAAELGKKRIEIRQVISDKLADFDEDTYIELVTTIAEKCIADDSYEEGIVLSDVIDQYEVRMQSLLERHTDTIQTAIDRIKQTKDAQAVSKEIKILIDAVQAWDVVAQPLQLKSKKTGIPHENTELVGRELRQLALFLNNEQGFVDSALTLVEAMKGVFAEQQELLDIFEKDSVALKSALKEREAVKDIIAEIDAIEKDAKGLRTFPTSKSIGGFVYKIRNTNLRLALKDPKSKVLIQLREHLFNVSFELALELYKRDYNAFASVIVDTLESGFKDIPELHSAVDLVKSKTVFRRNNFLQSLLTIWYSRKEQKHPDRSIFKIVFSVFLGLLIILAIVLSVKNTFSETPNESKQNSSSESENAKSSQTEKESRYSTSSNIGDDVFADIVSIFPELGIYTQGSSYYTDFVCKCKTSSGTTIWVYMSCSDYKRYFDATASTSTYANYAYEKSLSPSKKIHGTVKRAESIMSGLSSTTGTNVIDFSSVD